MVRLTKAEEYRESFYGLEVEELLNILERNDSKDLLYSLRGLYGKKDLPEIGFDCIKRVAEEGQTAAVRKMALNVIRKFYGCNLDKVDVNRKVCSGWVYFFENEINGFIKIGFTTNIEKRLKRLSKEEGTELREVHRIKTSEYSGFERVLHKKYDKYRVRLKGEWFDMPAEI